jgi:hypothetical protein
MACRTSAAIAAALLGAALGSLLFSADLSRVTLISSRFYIFRTF